MAGGSGSMLRRENRQSEPKRCSMQRREAGAGWFKLTDEQTRPGDPEDAADVYTAERRDLYFPLPIVRGDDVPAPVTEFTLQSGQAVRARQTAEMIASRRFWSNQPNPPHAIVGNAESCAHHITLRRRYGGSPGAAP